MDKLRNLLGRLLHRQPAWLEHTEVGPGGIELSGGEGNAGETTST